MFELISNRLAIRHIVGGNEGKQSGMLKNFLIVAWRNVTRRKLYTTIHVIGLAVGICACMSIWSITHYELSFDRFHPNRDRIYRVGAQIGSQNRGVNLVGCLPEPAAPELHKDLTG